MILSISTSAGFSDRVKACVEWMCMRVSLSICVYTAFPIPKKKKQTSKWKRVKNEKEQRGMCRPDRTPQPNVFAVPLRGKGRM